MFPDTNYAGGKGTTKCANTHIRQSIIIDIERQGLSQSNLLKLPRMTYRLFEDFDLSYQPPKRRYCVQWRGQMD